MLDDLGADLDQPAAVDAVLRDHLLQLLWTHHHPELLEHLADSLCVKQARALQVHLGQRSAVSG